MKGLEIHIREKRFADVPVFGAMDITIAASEFVAIVGPSGIGKSTLLAMVAGLDPDYAGVIRHAGRPLAALGRSPAGLGMVFQQPRLMPWLNARDNVRLAESERLAHDDGYTSRADALLAEVG